MAATITKYDIRKVNSETIIVDAVDCNNINSVVNNFMLWIKNPIVDTFDITDDKLDIAVIITYYIITKDNIKYSTIDLSYKFNNKYYCNKYQVERTLSDLDMDNISSIISFFCKMSTTDKVLIKSKSIHELINQHMIISNFTK